MSTPQATYPTQRTFAEPWLMVGGVISTLFIMIMGGCGAGTLGIIVLYDWTRVFTGAPPFRAAMYADLACLLCVAVRLAAHGRAVGVGTNFIAATALLGVVGCLLWASDTEYRLTTLATATPTTAIAVVLCVLAIKPLCTPQRRGAAG